MHFDVTGLIIIPLLIFLSRIMDVSIGTLRVIFVSKGYRSLAPLLGFFEILIWLIAMREIMGQLDNALYFFAYAAGFAAGNYVGMFIEEKLSLGLVIIRIVFREAPDDFLLYMRMKNHGFTLVEGKGNSEKVKILFSVVKRHKADRILEQLRLCNPKAFYTIEDVRTAREGIFNNHETVVFNPLRRRVRKSK